MRVSMYATSKSCGCRHRSTRSGIFQWGKGGWSKKDNTKRRDAIFICPNVSRSITRMKPRPAQPYRMVFITDAIKAMSCANHQMRRCAEDHGPHKWKGVIREIISIRYVWNEMSLAWESVCQRAYWCIVMLILAKKKFKIWIIDRLVSLPFQ